MLISLVFVMCFVLLCGWALSPLRHLPPE